MWSLKYKKSRTHKNVVHIRTLKQALDHYLVLKIAERVIKFKQVARLKQQIEMNTDLRTNYKNDFSKD